MKIRKLNLRNFLSFGSDEQEFQFDSLNTIVGPNNSGKTNVLRALSLPLQPIEQSGFDPRPYCYGGDPDNRFYLKISLEFNDEEMRALADFIACSPLIENLGLKAGGGDAETFKSFMRDNAPSLAKDIFSHTSIIMEGGSSWQTPGYIAIGIEWNGKALFISQLGVMMKEPAYSRSYGTLGFGQQLLDVMRTDPSKSAGENLFPILSKKFYEPEPYGVSLSSFQVGNILPTWGPMPEIGRLQSFAYKRGSKEQYFHIFQLIFLIYRSSVVRTSDLRNKPRAYLSFDEDLELHETDFNGLTGEETPLILFKLKNSALPQHRTRYRNIMKIFGEVSNGSEFDIIVRPTRIKIGKREELARFPPTSLGIQTTYGFGTTTGPDFIGVRAKEEEISTNELSVHIIKEGLSIPLELAAAGLVETLLLLIALIDQHDKTILLDEPAQNLHPNLQLRFVELFEKSIATDRNQIIMVTHSPYLLDPRRLSSIWRMSRKNGESTSKNLGSILEIVSIADKEKMRLLMSKSDVKGILFSRGVVLTEGASDRIIIEMIDKGISERDHKPSIDDSEWALIETGGKMSMMKFVKLLDQLGIPFAMVADHDAAIDCKKTLTTEMGEIRTSQLFADLFYSKLLTEEDLGKLKTMEASIKENGYSRENFDKISKIAKKHNAFILSATLEEIIGASVERRESKPLLDSQRMRAILASNLIPQELVELLIFLKSIIRAAA